TEFADKNGKVVLYKLFDKPFEFSVPLKDDQPYSLQMGLVDDDKKTTVVRYDDQLVSKGIESISLDMYPQDDYFFLTVRTGKGIQLPLTITLKNTKGEELWKQKLTAPLDQLIRAYVSTPGDYLELALDGKSSKGFVLYPNPIAGTLFIDNFEHRSPIRMSIRDLNGKTVLAEREVAPGPNA